MSWSVSMVGKPENVAEALDKHSETLSGPSKEEFDAALPNMKALISMNNDSAYPMAIKLEANGHAWKDTTREYSCCNVSIAQLGLLV